MDQFTRRREVENLSIANLNLEDVAAKSKVQSTKNVIDFTVAGRQIVEAPDGVQSTQRVMPMNDITKEERVLLQQNHSFTAKKIKKQKRSSDQENRKEQLGGILSTCGLKSKRRKEKKKKGSTPTPKIPVIDFSRKNLIPGTYKWNSAKDKVVEALKEYGCFEALFDKDSIIELQNWRRSKPKAYPESMVIEEAHILGNVESFINNYWPQGNPTLSKSIQSFTERVSELDKMVRKMILESFGVEKYMDEHMNSTTHRFRMIRYNPHEAGEAKIALHSHQDKNLLTILLRNQVDGFELQSRDGEWIQLKQSNSPCPFIVLAGLTLSAWLNGRLSAAYHRVVLSRNEASYTLALFCSTKPGYIVKALEELVDEEHPLQFKPFDFHDYMKFVALNPDEQLGTGLESFCGVNQPK
ncbi:probable 2-oxoglutarate-dependent dioxygenase AOP1 [Rutidosis leptorrhynchoides]|uniref:probable 2-oxoglutarate-dependent dioxygenase AOP1 n=1 Tax=Rutidosis leptorrhynchoides TaxID=125765 RepID=UPI003A996345